MVQQSTLLQIIQFVGLITPALAILIELLVRFHGGLDELQANRTLPIEIQILFLGFSAILLGGMGIGIQMILTLDDRVTQLAALLIFGGLPFLATSVLAMHVRISVVTGPDAGLIEGFIIGLRRASSVGLPLILTSIIYFGVINWLQKEALHLLSWWIFRNGLRSEWYFYIVATILIYKVMYSLWTHESIPTDDPGNVLRDWFVTSFTVGTFFSLLTGTVFAIYYILLLLKIPLITPSSELSAIPYIWGGVVVLALLYADVDPNTD